MALYTEFAEKHGTFCAPWNGRS